VTEISFRFNAADRLGYACRYLRKVQRAGRAAVVTGPAERLEQLDRMLWSFDASDFIPHLRLRAGESPQPRHAPTPIWLAERVADAPHHGVLVNLGEAAPEGFETFERVVEIVSTDADDRAAARQRWRHYQSRGYKLESHEASD
jgi:DNA polymerase III subunit chi